MNGAAPAGAVWRVQLLGRLRLDDGQREITRLPSRAVAALLARLALAPQRDHAREELIERLWPGVELDVGRNRLRQALSTLKSLLEPPDRQPPRTVLLADRQRVRVADGALACDAVLFEAALKRGDAAAAAALYGGELLPGFYDEWIDDERVRLAALHDRLAARSPAPAAAGAPAAPPSAAPPSAPHAATDVRLPSFVSRLFGAEAPARALRDTVLAHRVVTLLGPGGSGKTRLAIEVAHSLRGRAGWPLPVPEPAEPFDLIAFVSLVACATRAQVVDAIAGALRLGTPGAEPLHALADALATRRALLVLDNFEQLVDTAADVVAQLAARAPALHLLVTSRRALGLDGERTFMQAPLPLPPADADLAAAAANPAVALFVERAQAVRADFHLGARNAATLVALVRTLEGLPLAIELAASRARSVAPAEMLRHLAGRGTPRLDLLARGGARSASDPRHATMQRAIAWSWDLLAPEQAALLAALTVFAGPFGGDAAAALATDPSTDVLLRLDELVAHSLVQAGGDGEVTRYSVFQPVREFALARTDAASARASRARLRAWALDWARSLPRTPPLPAMRAEMPNLVAALASAVQDGAEADALQLLLQLRRALEDVELPADGLAHARAAVERCGDPALQARGHALLAPLLYTAGHADDALRHAEAGVRRDLLEGAALGRALHALARVRWRSRRRAAEVEPLLDEAASLAEDDAELQASLLALRAFVANAAHRDFARGEALHVQALALWERQGNQHAVHSGRYNLAVVAESAGRPAQALERIAPVIDAARALGDARRLSQSLNVRGNALASLRRWPEAVAVYRECVRVAWQSLAAFDLAYGLWNLPRALAHARQPDAAVQLLAFATAYWRHFGDLDRRDLAFVRRVQRLLARAPDATRAQALWREGEALTLAQAVALALDGRADT